MSALRPASGSAAVVVAAVVVAAAIGAALGPLAALNRPALAWDVRAVEVVGAAAPGAPVTAFVDASCAA